MIDSEELIEILRQHIPELPRYLTKVTIHLEIDKPVEVMVAFYPDKDEVGEWH